MNSRAFFRSKVAPWSGALLGPLAWLLHHQGYGNALYFDCNNGNPLAAIIVGVLALALALLGGWLSWRAQEPVQGANPQTRRFVALVAVMLAAVFALTIVIQTLAGLILPGCYA